MIKHHSSNINRKTIPLLIITVFLLSILVYALPENPSAPLSPSSTEEDDLDSGEPIVEEMEDVTPQITPSKESGAAKYNPQTKSIQEKPSTYICLNSQRCKEIDEVWALKISAYVGNNINQIWDTRTSPQKWKNFAEVYEPPPPQLITPPRILPKYSGTGKCFSKALSNSKEEANYKVGTLTFQGNTITENKIIIPLLKKIDQEITAKNLNYPITVNSAYSWRCINSPKVKIVDKINCIDNKGIAQRSKHSYGIAIDINLKTNPFCLVRADGTNYYKTKEGNEVECKKYNGKYYDMPEEIIQIFKANDFSWGGDWSGAKDYMHFDWKGNLGDFKGNGNIEPCSTSTPNIASNFNQQQSPQSSSSLPQSPSSSNLPSGKQWEQYTATEAWNDALSEIGITGQSYIWKSSYNGKNDNLERIDTGRDAIIFAPQTTNFNQPVDIIYYFHGQGGFGLDMSERVLRQAKSLSNVGKNFIVVFPELAWSRGTFDESKPNTQNPRIKGRQSLSWNGVDSDFAKFHQEVLNIINTNFANNNFQKGKIAIIGHSNGGSAIGMAAEKDSFNSVKPDIITFSDADYRWGSKIEAQEVWDHYLKTNPAVELNLVVQAPSEPSNHEPTKYAIKFLSDNNLVLNNNNTKQHFSPNINYLPLTKKDAKSTVINVEQDSSHRPSKESGLHGMIARMSIYWTMTHDSNLNIS